MTPQDRENIHQANSRAEPPAASAPIRCDVAIVGGGMVGMTTAIALGAHGVRTALIEAEAPAAQEQAGYDGRSSAIAYGSQRLLNALGVWEGMAHAAQPITDIRVSDGAWHIRDAAPFFVHYDYRMLPPGSLPDSGMAQPPFGWIVENRATRISLLARIKTCPGLLHLAPAELADATFGDTLARLFLKDGRHVEARLVIAADGRNSLLRRLGGIKHTTFGYRQTGIVCTVTHEKPHRGVAHEHFLPTGPFAMLPMTSDRDAAGNERHRSSIVWTEDPRIVPLLLSIDDAAFGREIERRFGLSLGHVRPLGKRFAYPLGLLLADAYARPRLALAGDAAHAIHPIAGQGFNLGIRDVGALAEAIVSAHRLGLDPGALSTLEDYARRRRFDNLLLAGVTDVLTRLFSNDFGPLRLARDLGFYFFNRTPPLKRLAMRHAMGVVGSLPKLMRGQSL